MEGVICCKMCNVTLPGRGNVQIHFMGKKHQAALNFNKKTNNEIIATGLPSDCSEEEILKLFSTFGKVESSVFGWKNEFAVIHYENSNSVENLLRNKNVCLKNRQVHIKKVYKSEVPDSKKTPPKEKNVDIIKVVTSGENFNTQLNLLINILQPNRIACLQKFNHLCFDLQSVLSREFVGCLVHPFGSTVTGLVLANSDVDIYIELRNRKGQVENEEAEIYLKKARKLLFQSRGLFTNIFAIPKAKTPIVKCVHSPTNISCDFNFKNMLGVCNSLLIKYFLHLDPQLHNIAVLLKYWGSEHDITGTGKISNYSLIMLLIFYLQQSPYKLPSVQYLQNVPGTPVNLQNGWNAGFSQVQYRSAHLNNATPLQILKGFFKFYASFDYSLYVISPYVGQAIVKSDFLYESTVPTIFVRYRKNISQEKFLPLKINTVMCIQDPFEQNHNVASAVGAKMLQNFVSHCRISVEILTDPNEKNILPNMIKQATFKKLACKFKELQLTIPVGNSLMYLEQLNPTENIESSTEKILHLRNTFYELVNNFVLIILSDVLHCDVKFQEPKSPKSPKIVQEDSDLVSSYTFRCVGRNNTWGARKYLSKQIQVHGPSTFIDNEIALSWYILHVLQTICKPQHDIVDFNIEIQNRLNPTQVFISLKNNLRDFREFSSLVTLCSKNFVHWFEKHVADETGTSKRYLESKNKRNEDEKDNTDEQDHKQEPVNGNSDKSTESKVSTEKGKNIKEEVK